ncbi:reduced folate transporter isoform X2 [Pieris rapae]|uniref:reduced folate transporter isoform X2 n=1 Tax=Pieris rapae TaxID=64459 RepID=UPI001E27F713|nr:reduced folate transporter isoform X2 [Pieris rapae]
MHSWIKITLILCLFGTLREIRPSEPFVTDFLLGKWRNITESQLNRDVYPVGTYSYLGLLVIVFLITDFLRFKPVIILSGISGIAVYAVLLWTTSLEWLQVSQVLYGIYMATEVAYLTYIYAKVDSSKYPKVSSYTRMAALTGRFLSGVSSQLLIHFNIMDLRDLNYITLTAQILATFWAFWLPPVPYGIYFHRRSIASTTQSDIPIEKQPPQNGYDAVLYNGAVEALQTAFGAAGAFLAPYWTYAVLPAPIAAVQGVAMFLATYVNDISTSYTGYIVMGMLFHYTITLASAKIASQLSDESCFGLIFGINTVIGTGLQSILTLVLIQTLDLPIQAQYYFISGFFLLLASLWLLGCTIYFFKQKHSINLNQY